MDVHIFVNEQAVEINGNRMAVALPQQIAGGGGGGREGSAPYIVDVTSSSSSPSNGPSTELTSSMQLIKSGQQLCQKLRKVLENLSPADSPDGLIILTFALLCCVVIAIICALTVAGIVALVLLVCFVVLHCVPIATIVIGAVYWNKAFCPAVPKMSILLIVGGSIALVRMLLVGVLTQEYFDKNQTNQDRQEQDEGDAQRNSRPRWLRVLVTISRILSIGWFITAGVRIYAVQSTVDIDHPTLLNYCHPILYLYGFWYVTVALAVMCLVLGMKIGLKLGNKCYPINTESREESLI